MMERTILLWFYDHCTAFFFLPALHPPWEGVEPFYSLLLCEGFKSLTCDIWGQTAEKKKDLEREQLYDFPSLCHLTWLHLPPWLITVVGSLSLSLSCSPLSWHRLWHQMQPRLRRATETQLRLSAATDTKSVALHTHERRAFLMLSKRGTYSGHCVYNGAFL